LDFFAYLTSAGFTTVKQIGSSYCPKTDYFFKLPAVENSRL